MFDKIIFEKIVQYSENKPQPKGLTSKTTKKVSNYFKENFNSYLPQDYIEFLNAMNGFSNDGHSIFCCYKVKSVMKN